jgi:hypothetical protein
MLERLRFPIVFMILALVIVWTTTHGKVQADTKATEVTAVESTISVGW